MATTAITLTNTTTEEITLIQLRGRSVIIPVLSSIIIDAEDDIVDDDTITRRDLYESTQLRVLLDSGALTRSPSGVIDSESDVVQVAGTGLHATEHEDGGSDEIDVSGLSGELADPQPPKAHKDAHKSGGGDAFASGDLLEAAVKRIQTSTGPTTLTVGAIADGETLTRSGESIVGAAGGGGGFFSDGVGTNAAIGKGTVAPTAAGENSFAQGDNATAGFANCLVLGDGASVTGISALAVGLGARAGRSAINVSNDANSASNYALHVGEPSANTGANSISVGIDTQATKSSSFAQGESCHVTSFISMAQGADNTISSDRCFSQGFNCDIGSSSIQSFAQGGDNTINASTPNSFAQGYKNTVAGDRGFVQGAYGYAKRDDQKTWGSNRTGLGNAQCSKIVKHLETVNATTTTIVTIDTDTDKSYHVSIKAIARNTTTNGESSALAIVDELVHNDTGTAVKTAGTTTSTNSGGGSTAWTLTTDTSTADYRIRVTGDASDTLEWCVSVEFVEVAG